LYDGLLRRTIQAKEEAQIKGCDCEETQSRITDSRD
jgi:hypothetical protein